MTEPPDGRSKRRILRWVVVLVAVGALAAIFWPLPERPKYEGKTVEEWLLQLDPNSGGGVEYERAWHAIAKMDANALPDLERILSWRPSKWRECWNGWKVRLQLAKPEWLSPTEQVRRAGWAAYILAECGNVDVRPLLPHLTFHATNPGSVEMTRALASAGDEGVSVLTNQLFTGEPTVRCQAAWGLQFAWQRPQATAALLRSATIETNSLARVQALASLANSGATPAEGVPLGLRLLRSEDEGTRWMAAWLLADYRSIVEVSNSVQTVLSAGDKGVRDAFLRPVSR